MGHNVRYRLMLQTSNIDAFRARSPDLNNKLSIYWSTVVVLLNSGNVFYYTACLMSNTHKRIQRR